MEAGVDSALHGYDCPNTLVAFVKMAMRAIIARAIFRMTNSW
jgi:hypothetical protein